MKTSGLLTYVNSRCVRHPFRFYARHRTGEPLTRR